MRIADAAVEVGAGSAACLAIWMSPTCAQRNTLGTERQRHAGLPGGHEVQILDRDNGTEDGSDPLELVGNVVGCAVLHAERESGSLWWRTDHEIERRAVNIDACP